ncbi:MAG: hypothetical protein M1830_006883, partial [Pleopsidium flavum]
VRLLPRATVDFRGLQMPLAKRVALSGIFGMGIGYGMSQVHWNDFSLATLQGRVITLFRTIFTVKINNDDIIKIYASVGVLSHLEHPLGVINACLPFTQGT